MSVVNVAMTLAENGFRVLVVDLDLLAPGVQEYLRFKGEAIKSSVTYSPPLTRELGNGGVLDLVERQISSYDKSVEQQFGNPFNPSEGEPKTWQKWKRLVPD